MIGHHSSFLGRRIQRVWRPRRESFDNVAVHGGVTVRDFIVIRWINNEFGCDSVPIHLLRWIESMRIQFASLQNRIHSSQCERDKPNSMCIRCAFNSVLMSSVKGPLLKSTNAAFLIGASLSEPHTCRTGSHDLLGHCNTWKVILESGKWNQECK